VNKNVIAHQLSKSPLILNSVPGGNWLWPMLTAPPFTDKSEVLSDSLFPSWLAMPWSIKYNIGSRSMEDFLRDDKIGGQPNVFDSPYSHVLYSS